MVKAKSKPRVRGPRTVPVESEARLTRQARLAEVARLAQIFIDGDLLAQLLTRQGYRWTNGDDVDYKGASGNVDLQNNGNTTSGFIVWQAVRDTATKKVVYKTVARFTTEELVGQIQ